MPRAKNRPEPTKQESPRQASPNRAFGPGRVRGLKPGEKQYNDEPPQFRGIPDDDGEA